MVRKDASVDPRAVKVPYLRDNVRQEMYARHILQPEEWSVSALSQRYRTSIDRTKAVIVLMHKRYEMMRSKGFNVKIEGGNGESVKPHMVVEIPPVWKGLYEKYKEDPTKEAAQVLQAYNESIGDNEALKADMSAEKAKEIVETMKDHERRMHNLETHNNLMEDIVQKLRAKGIDSQRFQETANDVHLTGNKKSLKDSYYPSLFGDDNFEEMKASLAKRIAAETKAHIEHNVEYYNEKFNSNNSSDKKVTSPDNASRWKLAFRDLSKVDFQAGTLDTTTTMIRSRKGE